MKKIKVLFAMLVAMAVFTGCNSSVGSAGLNDDELFTKIAESVKEASVLKDNEYVRLVFVNRNKNSEAVIMGNNYYHSSSPYDDFVDDGQDVFGYFSPYNVQELRMFDEEMYDYFVKTSESRRQTLSGYSDNGTITSRKEKNGVICIETSNKVDSDNSEYSYISSYGIEPSEVESVEVLSEIDAKTYLPLKKELYFKVNGEKQLFSAITMEYNIKKDTEVYNKMHNAFFEGVTHTISVVVSPGTDKEKRYEKTANENTVLNIWLRDSNGEYELYDDEKCTVVSEFAEGYVPFDQDRTIYMK